MDRVTGLVIPPGLHALASRFARTGEHRGHAALLVHGVAVGAAEIAPFTPTRFSLTGAGLRCGRGDALAVSDDYSGPFPFTGGLERVVIEVDGPPFRDAAGEAAAAIRSQ